MSANSTRLFSVAIVDVHVLHAGELDKALAVAARVAAEMREDAAWSESFVADAPTNIWVTGIGMDGASISSNSRCRPVPRSPLRASFMKTGGGTRRGLHRDWSVGYAHADPHPVPGLLRSADWVRIGMGVSHRPVPMETATSAAASLRRSSLAMAIWAPVGTDC